MLFHIQRNSKYIAFPIEFKGEPDGNISKDSPSLYLNF